jgi:hypothetical protein
MNQLTAEELQTLQEINTEFAKAKMSLGELEMKKYNVLQDIEEMKKIFAEQELALIEKYGENSVINIKTGEITQKEEQ